MKRRIRSILTLLLIAAMLSSLVVYGDSRLAPENALRGVWVATVLNLDYPSKQTTDSEQLKAEALSILDNTQKMGLNAVFLQVRPTGDALYQSQYFPWSKYLTGAQGVAPSNGFDPLAFWVAEAHKRGIELHAWINPYRISKKAAADPIPTFAALAPSNPARLHQDWVVQYTDKNLYFDPGLPEVRQLIVDSSVELIKNYDIDGIHFDDYFYPGQDFNDTASFAKYGKGFKTRDDWRRENVNILIRNMNSAVHAASPKIRFGVSPFGIWANKKTNPLGSDTAGNQSYYNHYADTLKWVKEGSVDYIAPQLYWNIGYKVADYSKLLTWWKNATAGTGVELYIGQAAYRTGNSDPASPWYGVGEIGKQLQLNGQSYGCSGSIFYNYSALVSNTELGNLLKNRFVKAGSPSLPNRGAETAPVTPTPVTTPPVVTPPTQVSSPLTVARPAGNINTTLTKYYIMGSSDPSQPLIINGTEITNRSGKGYYGFLVNLKTGQNTITVSQGATQVQRVITLGAAASSPVTSTKPATAASTATPTAATATPAIETPLYGKVSKAIANTYTTPSTADGAANELYQGMVDRVTGFSGNYAKLGSGLWVSRGAIETSSAVQSAVMKNIQYVAGDKWDTLLIDTSLTPAATASFDGTVLKLNVPLVSSTTIPVLPDTALISSISAVPTAVATEYRLIPKPGQTIHGYTVEKTSSGILLHIKRPVHVATSGLPLSGITIMLDPGHGGTDTGAIGPMGAAYAEKAINLNTALALRDELQKNGATILMTRSDDSTVSLDQRLDACRSAKPDLFVSLHANAMGENVDCTKVSGFSVYYREAFASGLSQSVHDSVVQTLNRASKGSKSSNYYVTRGTWTPSILLETGFVPNPNEFEWLSDSIGQKQIAQAVADGIQKAIQ